MIDWENLICQCIRCKQREKMHEKDNDLKHMYDEMLNTMKTWDTDDVLTFGQINYLLTCITRDYENKIKKLEEKINEEAK
jgi:galactokinase/mevalonate kinase-like predicted kinase